MALPIAHSCLGLALGILRLVPRCGRLQEVLQLTWQRRVELFICILIANAPDIDFTFIAGGVPGAAFKGPEMPGKRVANFAEKIISHKKAQEEHKKY